MFDCKTNEFIISFSDSNKLFKTIIFNHIYFASFQSAEEIKMSGHVNLFWRLTCTKAGIWIANILLHTILYRDV